MAKHCQTKKLRHTFVKRRFLLRSFLGEKPRNSVSYTGFGDTFSRFHVNLIKNLWEKFCNKLFITKHLKHNIIIEHDTIEVTNLAQSWSFSTNLLIYSLFYVDNYKIHLHTIKNCYMLIDVNVLIWKSLINIKNNTSYFLNNTYKSPRA